MFFVLLVFLRLQSHIQHKPNAEIHTSKGRKAVAYKWKRDTCVWKDLRRHGNVDERLDPDEGTDAAAYDLTRCILRPDTYQDTLYHYQQEQCNKNTATDKT